MSPRSAEVTDVNQSPSRSISPIDVNFLLSYSLLTAGYYSDGVLNIKPVPVTGPKYDVLERQKGKLHLKLGALVALLAVAKTMSSLLYRTLPRIQRCRLEQRSFSSSRGLEADFTHAV